MGYFFVDVVEVKFHGPTSHRGARWGVRLEGFPKRYYSPEYYLDPREDASRAAVEYYREVVAPERYETINADEILVGLSPTKWGYYAVLLRKNLG